MNRKTEEKIQRVKTLLESGISKEELIKQEFNRSKKRTEEFLIKHKELLKPSESHREPLQVVKNENVPMNFTKDNIKALQEILGRSGEIIDLLDKMKDTKGEVVGDFNILDLPEDFKKIGDLRVRSQRISQSVETGLDSLLEKYPQFTKTSLINYAIDRLVKEYL